MCIAESQEFTMLTLFIWLTTYKTLSTYGNIKYTGGGRSMEKKSQMIGFKTTPEIKRALVSIAQKEDRSIGYIINRILTQYLSQTTDDEQKVLSDK